MAGVVYPAGYSPLLSVQANLLLTDGKLPGPAELTVEPNAETWPGRKVKDLPQETQERLKALMRAKLALDFDTTMLGTDWKKEG